MRRGSAGSNRRGRNTTAVSGALLVALVLGWGPRVRAADPAAGESQTGQATELSGQVVVSDVLLAPGAGAAVLKRFQRSVVRQVAGFWRLHLMAFLERAVDGDSVALGVYDVTDPGERRQVKVFDVPVGAGARTVHLNDFVVSPPMGFEAGHRYEMVIEPAGGAGAGARSGKSDAYAKGVVTLR